MNQRTFVKTGWSVSEVGMGCWSIGGQYGPVTEAEADGALRRAVDLGVTLFDTADAYGVEQGASEELVGRALRGVRDRVIIATKVGNWGRRFGHPLPYTHPTHIYGCCDASLHRLGTDRIDLYQCHIGDLADPDLFLGAFERLRERGKIRAYGISTDSVDVLRRFNAAGGCAACQLNYSLLNRQAEGGLLPYCRANGIATLIRGPLAQGLLGGRYDAGTRFADPVRQKWNDGAGRAEYLAKVAIVDRLRPVAGGRPLAGLALAFVLANPAVTAVIPGPKRAAQVEAHVAAAAMTLSAGDMRLLDAATGPVA